MSKMVKIAPETKAQIVRELADALVLDYEEDTRIMVESPRGINHKIRSQNGKIVV